MIPYHINNRYYRLPQRSSFTKRAYPDTTPTLPTMPWSPDDTLMTIAAKAAVLKVKKQTMLDSWNKVVLLDSHKTTIGFAANITERVIDDDDDNVLAPMKEADGPAIDDVLLEKLILAFIEKSAINSCEDVDKTILTGVDGGLFEEKKTTLSTRLHAIVATLDSGKSVRILPSNARITPDRSAQLKTLLGYISEGAKLVRQKAPVGLYRTDGPVTPPTSPQRPTLVRQNAVSDNEPYYTLTPFAFTFDERAQLELEKVREEIRVLLNKPVQL